MNVNEAYFEWLTAIVCGDRYPESISFRKLLTYLYETEFKYSIKRDANREKDGVDLRLRYADINPDFDIPYDKPCSILEMMVALSLRCEETIMDDPKVGNRTSQWFWGMIGNLGLASMMDIRFDEEYVKFVISRFLEREYEPNGRGGLFYIRNCNQDLRDVEIWYQLLWYLDTIA